MSALPRQTPNTGRHTAVDFEASRFLPTLANWSTTAHVFRTRSVRREVEQRASDSLGVTATRHVLVATGASNREMVALCQSTVRVNQTRHTLSDREDKTPHIHMIGVKLGVAVSKGSSPLLLRGLISLEIYRKNAMTNLNVLAPRKV